MDNPKILIIDDDVALCESTRDIIELEGYSVDVSYTAEDGVKKVESEFYNVILLDKKLPNAHGLVALEKIKEISPDTEVIIFTAYTEIDSVIAAMNKNAFSYLRKPCEIPELKMTLRKALEKQTLLYENRKLLQQVFNGKNDWESTFDAISDLISIYDVDSNVIRCNKALAVKLNVKPKDIIGRKCYEIYHGRNEPLPGCSILRCKETLKPAQEEAECMGGIFFMSCFPRFDEAGRCNGIVQIARDITERKKIENALQESEELFRRTFEHAGVGIVHVAPNGQFLRINKHFCDIFGHSEDKMLKLTFQDITHSDELEIDTNLANQLLDGKIKAYTMEKRYLKKDGTVIWVNLTISIVHKPDGGPKYFICVADDITERKQMEQILQESEQRFRAISDTANEGIIMVDNVGNISFWNKAAEREFGYSSEEAVGESLHKLVVPSHLQERLLEGFKRFRNTGQGPFVGRTVELTAIKKDGTEFPIEHSISAVKLKGIWHAVGIIRDITERKEAEEKVKHGIEKLKVTIEGIINALALTVEQRDPYTSGHQQRVSLLACAIADEMGLSEDQIEGIRMSGIVHDIGKMHIPAEILSRPGKLTKDEFNIVKSHAQVGYDILKGIEFPWPIADIVHQHHESMDGSGYPSGLSNGDILMEARILSVADVVEAMASHRPYRPALGMDIALEEISKDKDVRYDSGVVDACLKVIKEKGFGFDTRPCPI